MIVRDFAPGAIVGNVAVLCGLPRALSACAAKPSAALYWTAEAYRSLLLTYPLLSQRLFSATMRMLIEQEKSLLESAIERHRAETNGLNAMPSATAAAG